jgi:hypothetical protein
LSKNPGPVFDPALGRELPSGLRLRVEDGSNGAQT